MGEYIDRAEALSAISNWLRKAKFPLNASAYNRGEIAAYETAIEEISELPIADVAPVVHGEWRPGKEISRTMLGDETLAIEYDAFYCSSCGRRYKEYVLIYNYCPSCGAKIDGGDHDA